MTKTQTFVSLTNKPRNLIKNKLSSDQEERFQESDQYLSYYTKTIPITHLTVPIDEEFKSPKYYRYVVEAISNLGEDDEVSFILSTHGGRADGLTALLSALKRTQAYSLAIIAGDCHSAGSFLALSCDAIAVSPHSSMLCHYISYGSIGPANHVKKEVEHTEKISEQLFRNTYKYFLTEEEITACIEQDFQLWLDADQILERLQKRQELQKQEAEETSGEDSCEGNRPDCSCGSNYDKEFYGD